MKPKESRLFLMVALLMGLLSTGTAVLASGGLAQTDLCDSIGGFWNAETQSCELNTNIEIRVDYPVEVAGFDFAVDTINRYLDEQREMIAELVNQPGFNPTTTYSLYVDSEVYRHNESIVSVVLSMSTYTGGANPFAFYKTFIFNLDEQRELFFYDVFPPEGNPLATIAPLAQQALIDTLGDAADPSLIARGAAMDSANFRNFAITEDSVIFFFDEHQVAAGAVGAPQVEIPIEELGFVMTIFT